MSIPDGAVGDARKRRVRLPELEMEPTVLRAQIEHMAERIEGALVQVQRAEKQRDEANARIVLLEHRLAVADPSPRPPGSLMPTNEYIRSLCVDLKAANERADAGAADVKHLERSIRAVVLVLQDDKPADEVIVTLLDALEVRGA